MISLIALISRQDTKSSLPLFVAAAYSHFLYYLADTNESCILEKLIH
jgi:hypothetical protein